MISKICPRCKEEFKGRRDDTYCYRCMIEIVKEWKKQKVASKKN